MAIISPQSNVVVQGMTGKEGQRGTVSMLNSGTNVTCGVTPGKGGIKIQNLPVFDSIKEAKNKFPQLNTSVIYVPPLQVLDAASEAIASGLNTILIFTENVPIKDAAKILELSRQMNTRIIGPSSVGLYDTSIGKLGSIGGENESDMFSKGPVGIISKSGGLCSETSLLLTKSGLGQSTVVGIGGDVLIGTDFLDILKQLESDQNTKCTVILGEIGGQYEQLVAFAKKQGFIKKPIIAYISGTFAETLDRKVALGHAGAIIDSKASTATKKKEILKDAGILIADHHHEIPDLVKQALS